MTDDSVRRRGTTPLPSTSTEAGAPLSEAAVRTLIREEVATAIAAALARPSGELHAGSVIFGGRTPGWEWQYS